MIECYQTECGRPAGEPPATHRARLTTSGLLSEPRRMTDHSEQHPAEQERATGLLTNGAGRLDWEMIAVWSFAAFSFGAFIFAIYVIGAKCHVNSP